MKILFIIPNYNINADSTALVSKEYVYFLAKKGHEVTVLSFDNTKLDRKEITNIDNIKLISLIDERSKKSLRYSKNSEQTYFDLNAIKKIKIQLACKLKAINHIKTNEWPLDAISYKKILKYLDNHYDIIVSSSSPFFSHVLAAYLKRKLSIKKWVAMLWDPYVYNYTMPNRLSSRKKAAKKAFKNVDKILYSEGIFEKNIEEGFTPYYLSKGIVLKYPGLKEFEVKGDKKNNNLIYSGTFYEDIRNPKQMFDVLNKLSLDNKIFLYSKGCEKLVSQLVNKNDGKYELKEQVKKEELHKIMLSSGMLINLGNTITNQIPAKTYELISSGKPIINFHFTEKDPSLKYFRKYPLCYSLNLNNYNEEDIKTLNKYIKDNINKSLSFVEAAKDLKDYIYDVAIEEAISHLLD